MEKHLVRSVLVLMAINTMDSIMTAVVGPTMIFYFTDTLGGNIYQYGMLASISSISAIVMTSFYGNWLDKSGNKFRIAYLVSFGLGITCYLMYFIACLLPTGANSMAVYFLMASRCIEGMAVAGRMMSYTWVAVHIPREKQRTIFTFLSSSRTAGMILGPITTSLVAKINTNITIFGTTIPLNSYNSIGLIMVLGELIIATLMVLFLHEEPTQSPSSKKQEPKKIVSSSSSNQKGIGYAMSHFNIFFPVFTMFCVMSIFSIQGAFAPVAKNVGWGPVQISFVSSIGAALMAASMFVSGILSMHDVFSDSTMIAMGFTLFFLAGLGNIQLWHEGSNKYELALPLFLMMFAYPFIGPANRSKFTKAIHDNKELEGSVGVLMGLINQAAMLPGIYMPTIVMSFILRPPKEISASTTNKRELTDLAYYVPIFCILVFCGLIYQDCFLHKKEKKKDSGTADENDDGGVASENSKLVPSSSNTNGNDNKRRVRRRASQVEVSQTFSLNSETNRRMSLELNGIVIPYETKTEKLLMDKLYADKKEWDTIDNSGSSFGDRSEEFSVP